MSDTESIQRDLGRVEGKLDSVIVTLSDISGKLTARQDRIDDKIDKVNQRITDVDSKHTRQGYFRAGIAASAVFLLANAPAWLGLFR